MASHFNLKVITPEGIEFNDDVASLETTTSNGRIGILADHTNVIATIEPSILIVKTKNNVTEEFVVTSGNLFFENNHARIVTNQLVNTKTFDARTAETNIATYQQQLNKVAPDSLQARMLNERIKNNELILSLIKK